MENITINTSGQILKQGKVLAQSVLSVLGSCISLDQQFTLSDFFKMAKTYPQLQQISPVLPSLLEIADQNETAGFPAQELAGLIFYKTIEIKGFPPPPDLSIFNGLKGICGEGMKDLKFYHLETLLGHTISLGRLNHIVFGDKTDIFQYETFYTLFEFVEGVAWELSFNFNPLHCSIRR